MNPCMGKEFPHLQARSRANLRYRAGTQIAFTRNGHSLVELAVAVAVVAVLTGIGWGTLQDRVTTYRMFSVARMLQSDISTLRALALDTNRETRVHFVEADVALDMEEPQHGAWDLQVGNRASGSTQWDTLPIDEGGVVDVSGGERSVEEGGSDETRWISLASWGSIKDDAIVFSPRGWLVNPATDYVDGSVRLRVVNKRALLSGVDEHVGLHVLRTGLVRLQAVAQ